MNIQRLIAVSLLPLALTLAPIWTMAQATPQASAARASFSPQEIEALLAPIALYPDALLVGVLMASTYPLEVVQAERWVKANPGLQGKALEDALQPLPWDPAVKSLAAFPQVLQMMSDQIDWTQKLGDAFLAQEKEVLAAAQRLRKRALDQGQLASSSEQRVKTESAAGETVVRIEPANPQVVYVPTYNPTTVYGGWPYPAYPPYAYYPPGYTAGAMFFGFAAGAIVGSALWGDCDWHGGSVNINTQRYNSFNRSNVQNRNWSHNAAHRGAVPYRSQQVAQRYGRTQPAGAAARDQRYRGRTDTALGGTQRRNAGGVGGVGGPGGPGGVGRAGGAGGPGGVGGPGEVGGPGGIGGRGSAVAGADRRSGSGAGGSFNSGMHNASAFDTRRGTQTRDYSNRGASSLNSARASGNFGGSRGAGGGGFSGGGHGGGGGFGGGRGGGRR